LNRNKPPEGEERKSIELERIYLLKAFSGKGIGTEVLTQIIKMSKAEGDEIIWLKSMERSESVRFYKKLRFKTIQKERLPFEGLKDEYRIILTMRLYLNER
jgi:GNAT superfamily N-acetyltransferase